MARFISLGEGHYRLTGGLRGVDGPGRRVVRNLDLRGFDGERGDRLASLATFADVEHLILTEASGADLGDLGVLSKLTGLQVDGGGRYRSVGLRVPERLGWLMINDQAPGDAQQIVDALPWADLQSLRTLVLLGSTPPIDLDLAVLKSLGNLEELTLDHVRHVGEGPPPFDPPVCLPRTLRRIQVMSDTPNATTAALRAYLGIPEPEVTVTPDGDRIVADDPDDPMVRVSLTPWTRADPVEVPPALPDWSVVESEDYVGSWWTSGELLRVPAYADLVTEHDAAERAEQAIRRRDRALHRRLDFDPESEQTAIYGSREDLEAAIAIMLERS